MNYIDIVIALLLAFGLIRGYFKGFIVEITSLAGLVLGIYGAIHFSYFLSNILKNYVSWDASMMQLVSFAGTFIIILVLISILGKVFTKIAESIALGFLNKFLGALFGLLKVGLIVSVVLMIFSKINKTLPFVEQSQTQESVLYEPIKNLAPAIFPNLIKEVEKVNEK
jgi:membrane protein required for colicin V production